MSKSFDEFNDDSILYELLEYLIRKQDPELAKCKSDAALLPASGTIKNALRYLNQRYSLPESIGQQISLTLPWKFTVGDNGRLLAILQEHLIEIRKSKDEYSSVVAKASVPKDAFPQWRKIVWSPDGSILVLASSNGYISFYNSLGNNIWNISPKNISQNPHILEAGDAVASMIFINSRTKSDNWTYEFISVTYSGLLKSYHISGDGRFTENHEFSFGNFYKNGVNAVAYTERHNLLFVAGNSITQKYGAASETGLSSWRLLNDYPYYKLSFTHEDDTAGKSAFSLWNFIPTMHSQPQSIIFKISISPKGDLMACIHTDGSITLWSLPNLKLLNKWKLTEQPDYNARNPLGTMKYKKFPLGTSEFYPLDIGWWSDHALIITRYSGSISVCSIKDLRNLLGTSPEFLAGQPQISELSPGRGCLTLDCETLLTSNKRKRDTNNETGSDSDKEEDELEPITVMSYTTNLVQSALYSITDIERFQPKRKKSKVLHRTYRILGLKSTTPEELYSRKIDIEEYGEALALANTYNLDTDLVYQTQWRKSEFSLKAIQDHLSKVRKRSWVLNECVMRVPETLEAARELLYFGLRGTSLETLVAIGKDDDGKFVPNEMNKETEDLDLRSSNLIQAQKENKILEELDMEHLTEGQKDLIKYRRKLFDHLDKLQTYEIILESPDAYDKTFYEEFRQRTAIENAVRFAKDSNYQGVEIMITYHGEKLMPHWLAIISFFPETLNPLYYQKLLPECDSEGQLFLLDRRELRQKDWSDRPQFSKLIGEDNEDGSEFIYDCDMSLSAYRNTQYTPELLQKWYRSRAYKIESDSSIVDNALELVKLGKARNITGLENLLLELETLDDLIYKVYLEDMTLARLEKLTDLEKMNLLMSTSDQKSFVVNIKNFVLPFIKRKQKYLGGELNKYLLHDYLVSLSKDDLTLPVKFFEYVKQSHDIQVVEMIDDVVTLALDCIYSCHEPDMYDMANEIFESIPKHANDTGAEGGLIDDLERELDCLKILNKYHVKTTLNYIKQNKNNPENVKLLLIQMARSLNKVEPPADEHLWAQLLNDMLEIHSTTFSCIDIEICFEICVSARLVSGMKSNIQNCANLIETKKNEQSLLKVSYERAVELILQASFEYFNSSKSLTDSNMELAKTSLHLITDDNPRIKEEYDLINSLQILNEFNVNILPIQVRLNQDRLKLIESCLNCRGDAYKSKQRLLTLANYLRIDKNNTRSREGKVLKLIAEKAFELADYDVCTSTCQQLIDNNYSLAWRTCMNLGYCEDFQDLKFRQKCLWFAMNNCPDDLLEETLKQKHLLEIQILHKDLQNWMPECDESFATGADSEDEFTDAMTTPQVETKEFVPNIIGTSTEIVKSSAELVTRSTFNIMKNVGNKDFWKTTLNLGFMSSPDNTVHDRHEIWESERDRIAQSFPCFYESLHEGCKISNFDADYTKYSLQKIENVKLKLCQTLLRVAVLTESACYGLEASDINHLYLECAEHTIIHDCLLGFAYLLCLRDTEILSAETVFNNLPRNELYVQYAAYYYALILYEKLNQDSTDVYYYDPLNLITAMVIAAKKNHESDIGEALIRWLSYLSDGRSSATEDINIEQPISKEGDAFKFDVASPVEKKDAITDENALSTDKLKESEISDKFKVLSTNSEEDAGWNDTWDDFSDQSDEEDKNKSEDTASSSILQSSNVTVPADENFTEEERFEYFQRIISTTQNEEQYTKAKELLLRWPKFTFPEFLTVDKHPALKLLEIISLGLKDNNDENAELQALQQYKDIMSKQLVPKDLLVEYLKRKENQRLLEYDIFLQLCTDDPILHEEAIKIIKDKHKNFKLLPPLLRELFFKNLTVSFDTSHPVYHKILEEVFSNCNRADIVENVNILIHKLIERRNIIHAVALQNQLAVVPPSLATFETALGLLMKK
ncbi:neuroblastoma-amplified sequence [Cephus cinctus]|uniref:Neuroblastoma-amplified sequence n=1 Tax=Cephus cinctus TaxID=211228 RepID=A0AAJ7CB26_CEPCN|nr:neuroblastoma-amplified sequence [Cephus cinctus]